MRLSQTFLILLLTCISISSAQTQGQDKFKFPNSSDLGINITSLLSSFVGNTNSDLNPENFPFIAKLNRGKTAVRFGLGLKLRQSDEILFAVEQVVFNNFQVNARVGFERKKYLGHKVGFFYGLDLISQVSNKEDVVSNSVDITTISENGYGIGTGPIFGFEYYFNKNLYFGAEGSFYTIYTYSKKTETFNQNPSINAEKTSSSLDSNISAPSRLYVMIRF